MTEAEKKLLQAQHRLEEVQARNRVKERKARTAGSFRRGRFWRKCCRRFSLLSCLNWRGIFHDSWKNKTEIRMGGLRGTGGFLFFLP